MASHHQPNLRLIPTAASDPENSGSTNGVEEEARRRNRPVDALDELKARAVFLHRTPFDMVGRPLFIPKPDLFDGFAEQLQREPEPTWLDEIKDDWRDFVSEVRFSPYSHALVAILTIIGWTALLVLPLVLS